MEKTTEGNMKKRRTAGDESRMKLGILSGDRR